MSDSITLKLEGGEELKLTGSGGSAVFVNDDSNYKNSFVLEDHKEYQDFFRLLSPFAHKTPEDRCREESERLPVGCTAEGKDGRKYTVLTNAFTWGLQHYDHITVLDDKDICETMLTEFLTKI